MEGSVNHKDFNFVLELISKAQNNAIASVNKELVLLYWNIGEYVSNKVLSGDWGGGVVAKLADTIQKEFPNLKGFNMRGLYRMRQFYDTYSNVPKVSSLVTQLSWTNNLMILSKCKTIEEKQFYVVKSSHEKWSSRELQRQIETSVYERTVLSKSNVSAVMTQIHPKAPSIFKDSYVFEFLDLPHSYDENDFQKQLLSNLKKVMMELGGGFTFVGEEYRLQVGMHDYYLDLLFYHRQLQCLVAVELKTVEFTPEHMGKLNFYLEALDSNVKMPHENPSIGILICKGKDIEVVEFSLRRNLSPAMVADYETKLIDKKILQQKVHEMYAVLNEMSDNE